MKKIFCVILVLLYLFVSNIIAFSYDCSQWAVNAIDKAYKSSILSESDEISFNTEITRVGFCDLIYKLMQTTDYFERFYYENTNGGAQSLAPFAKRPFDDTDSEAVHSLYNHNIVNGKTVSEFAPDDFLTREEAATIIVRFVNVVNPIPVTEIFYEYDDVETISDWAMDSVQAISNMGFMKGIGDNRFAPKDRITTEQAVVTVMRVYDVLNSGVQFKDKDGNVLLTEDDILSCEVKCESIFENDDSSWFVELSFSREGQEKFKSATAVISKYMPGENYISITLNGSIISQPIVADMIDSDIVIISGNFSEEAAGSFAETINKFIKY